MDLESIKLNQYLLFKFCTVLFCEKITHKILDLLLFVNPLPRFWSGPFLSTDIQNAAFDMYILASFFLASYNKTTKGSWTWRKSTKGENDYEE